MVIGSPPPPPPPPPLGSRPIPLTQAGLLKQTETHSQIDPGQSPSGTLFLLAKSRKDKCPKIALAQEDKASILEGRQKRTGRGGGWFYEEGATAVFPPLSALPGSSQATALS